MMHLGGSSLYIDEIKQDIYYFILPKSVQDILLINVPIILHETIDRWVVSGEEKDMFLDAINRKFSFYDAKVDRYIIRKNRYDSQSRDLSLSFSSMLIGWRKRNA